MRFRRYYVQKNTLGEVILRDFMGHQLRIFTNRSEYREWWEKQPGRYPSPKDL